MNSNFKFVINKIKNNVLIHSVLIGVLTGVVIVLFRITIQYLFQKIDTNVLSTNSASKYLLFPLITTLGGLISGILVTKFAPESKGSGIPYVKATLMRFGNLTRVRSVFVKFFGGIATIGTGMSLGREGPSVQLGAGIGAFVGKMFRVSGTTQNKLISAGAGAAIAATFNAPIAGSIFVMEELMQKFNSSILFPALIATVCASFVARTLLGNNTAFNIPYIDNIQFYVVIYSVLGVLSGCLGVVWAKIIHHFNNLYSNIRCPAYIKPAIAGLCCGIIGLFFPLVLGSGNLSVDILLQHKISVMIVLTIFILKFFLTPVCFGSGAVGGIFLPMLTIGAFFGYLTGFCCNLCGFEVNLVVMALIGMASFLAAVAKTPITASVMVFEMTGSYNLILPIMLACAISDYVALKLGHKPIYSELIVNQTKNTSEARFLEEKTARDIIKKVDIIFREDDLLDIFLSAGDVRENIVYPIVNKGNKLTGSIEKLEIEDIFINVDKKARDIVIKNVMNPYLVTAKIDEDLYKILFRLHSNKADSLFVINDNKEILGIIHKKDIYDLLSNS